MTASMASWMTASSSATPRNAPTTARSIIAYFEDGVVRGAAELHPPEQSPRCIAGDRVQRRSVGAAPGRRQHAVREADRGGASEGISEPAHHHRCAERSDAGARQQVRRAPDVPATANSPGYRSEPARIGRKCAVAMRHAGRGHARRSRTSIAPIGGCCCGYPAGSLIGRRFSEAIMLNEKMSG